MQKNYFTKTKNYFILKPLNKQEVEGNFLSLIKKNTFILKNNKNPQLT